MVLAECGGVCGQLRGVSLERNKKDYFAEYGSYGATCKTVADGVERPQGRS